MALEHVDPFLYANSDAMMPPWTGVNATGGGIQTANGRFGGRWMALGEQWGTQSLMYKAFPARSTRMVQFGYKALGYNSVNGISVCKFTDDASVQVLIMDDHGLLKAFRGDGITLLGDSGDLMLSAGAWHQFEVKAVIDPAAGSVLVRIDSVEFINLTDVNTRATSNSSTNRVYFGPVNGGGGGFGVSDLIVMNTDQVGGEDICNDLLGNRRLLPCYVSSEGAYADSTPSTGSDRSATIDEATPNGDTDYNSLAAAGDKDSFDQHTNVDNPNAIIDAVVMLIACRTDDGGAAGIKGFVKSGASEANGPALSVPSSYDVLMSPIYKDPATNAPFTAAGFNACEVGYERDT